jgi:hypothetical protein
MQQLVLAGLSPSTTYVKTHLAVSPGKYPVPLVPGRQSMKPGQQQCLVSVLVCLADQPKVYAGKGYVANFVATNNNKSE